MASLPVPWWILIPAIVTVLYFGWRAWRRRPERVVRTNRLWLLPTCLAAIILPLLSLQPHKPFDVVDYGIFGFALVLGATTGAIRAQATSLRYDEDTGHLMASLSLSALLLLLPVGVARYISREYFGIGPNAVSHGDGRAIIGSLLFVLSMVLAHRLLLYLRARGLLSRRKKD